MRLKTSMSTTSWICKCKFGCSISAHLLINHEFRAKSGRGSVAGYCVGILVGTVVTFVIVRYLQLLRQILTERNVGLTRLTSARDEHEAMELGQVQHRSSKVTY